MSIPMEMKLKVGDVGCFLTAYPVEEIKELYVDEENVLHVETSPAVRIAITSPTKLCTAAYDTEGTGEPVTKASLKLESCMKYVRVTVTDAQGKQAYSNAYFVDEILK